MRAPPFWALGVEEALAQAAGSARGLSSKDAAARLARCGPNELAPPRRFEALREIARFLANPLVLILLVASAISAAFGQVVSSVIIALMMVLSAVLNFTQAYRSQRAAARTLGRKAPKHALAEIRDDFHRIVYAPSADAARAAFVASSVRGPSAARAW